MMRKIILLFVALAKVTYATEIDIDKLAVPYNKVALMPYNPSGWHTCHGFLQYLIQKFNVKVAIEVGSWMGLSTIDLAQMIPENGKVYAVDTWKGSPNEQHDPYILATLYDQFLSNIIHTGLTEKVVPIRMSSVEAAQVLNVTPDMIYIDATHTYEACYADLQAWYPHLSEKGVICGDDLVWGDAGVAKAVTQFATENKLNIYGNGYFWWLEK